MNQIFGRPKFLSAKTALQQLHLFNVRWLISSIADRVTALHRFLPLQRLPERDRAQVSVNSADGFPKEGPNFLALAAFRKRFRSYSLHMVHGPVGATKGAAAFGNCELS